MRTFARLLPLLPLTLALPVAAGETLDPQALCWTQLEFKAKKLFFTARSQVRLESLPAADAAAEWIESPHGAGVEPRGPRVLEVTIESSGVGGASTDSVWFDPQSADAFQRLKTRGGKKAYRKAVRFSDEGAYVRRTSPIDGAEARLPPADWKRLETFYYPHPEDGGCRHVTEPSVLLYVLSADPGLEEGASRRLCVFSDKRTVPMAIEVTGSEEIDVDYLGAPESSYGRRRVDAWRVALRPLAEGDDFEFLGLDGEVEVLLEKGSRLPLEVRGRIGGFGRVTIHLTAVEHGGL